MSNLLDTIKVTAINAVEQSRPVAILFGRVVSLNPLKVQVDQKFTIDRDHLLPSDVLINLEVGDKLTLLRMQGGQQYFALYRERH